MVQILTIDSEFDSAQRLGYETLLHEADIDKKQIVIRWGYGRASAINDFPRVYNPAINISLNVNKPVASKLLAEVVDTPKIYHKNVPDGKEAVIRYHEHTNGEDFNVIRGPYQIPANYYAKEYIHSNKEYRVWFALDKTICAQRLCSKDKSQYPCRSSWGYGFVAISKRLHDLTMKAKDRIGLHFGAADVIFAHDKYYFLELNSAPSVDHKAIRVFFQGVINGL